MGVHLFLSKAKSYHSSDSSSVSAVGNVLRLHIPLGKTHVLHGNLKQYSLCKSALASVSPRKTVLKKRANKRKAAEKQLAALGTVPAK